MAITCCTWIFLYTYKTNQRRDNRPLYEEQNLRSAKQYVNSNWDSEKKKKNHTSFTFYNQTSVTDLIVWWVHGDIGQCLTIMIWHDYLLPFDWKSQFDNHNHDFCPCLILFSTSKSGQNEEVSQLPRVWVLSYWMTYWSQQGHSVSCMTILFPWLAKHPIRHEESKVGCQLGDHRWPSTT